MKDSSLSDELRYRILKAVERNPDISQRELAKKLGISLGKTNYCIKALVEIGYLKWGNFTKSESKLGYVYVLTPSGLKEKVQVTLRFLASKKRQYNELKKEIADLQREVENS